MTLMSSKRDWEIVHIPEKPPIPPHQQPTVNVYAALIDPKHTNTLVRKLNQIAPLENLRHVKRVRKQHLEKGKTQLSVILCLACENGCQQDSIPNGVLELISSYQFANLLHYQKKSGKNSANYGQLRIIHQPINIDGITGFSEEDSHSIHNFMKLTVDMAKSGDGQTEITQVVNAAIIVDPSTKQVIASACDQVRSQNSLTNQAGVETCFFEQQEAYTCHPIASSVEIHKKLLSNPSSAESRQLYTGVACLYPWQWAEQQLASCFRHPLRHAAIVAIEYSAARDRHLFPGIGHTGSNSTQMDLVQYSLRGSPVKRQKTNLEDVQDDEKLDSHINGFHSESVRPYLCTGYDVFLVWEPCTLCAMALVHQRVRRIFYAFPNPNEGALGSVRRLQGEKSLNHHYAVFRVLLPAEILEKERKTIVATCDDDKNNTT
ncbi:unnamed protein product [Camellia sinensis]